MKKEKHKIDIMLWILLAFVVIIFGILFLVIDNRLRNLEHPITAPIESHRITFDDLLEQQYGAKLECKEYKQIDVLAFNITCRFKYQIYDNSKSQAIYLNYTENQISKDGNSCMMTEEVFNILHEIRFQQEQQINYNYDYVFEAEEIDWTPMKIKQNGSCLRYEIVRN